MTRWYLPAVAVVLVTVAVVLATLSLVALALVVAWLAGSFSIDRLLSVVGAVTGLIGLLVTVLVPIGKRLLRRSQED